MTILLVFVIGYIAITLEHQIKMNKAATALLTGAICWTIYCVGDTSQTSAESLTHHLSDIAGVLFFLLGALTIV